MLKEFYFQLRLLFASKKQRKVMQLKKYIAENPLKPRAQDKASSFSRSKPQPALYKDEEMNMCLLLTVPEHLYKPKKVHRPLRYTEDLNMNLLLTAPDHLLKTKKELNLHLLQSKYS